MLNAEILTSRNIIICCVRTEKRKSKYHSFGGDLDLHPQDSKNLCPRFSGYSNAKKSIYGGLTSHETLLLYTNLHGVMSQKTRIFLRNPQYEKGITSKVNGIKADSSIATTLKI